MKLIGPGGLHHHSAQYLVVLGPPHAAQLDHVVRVSSVAVHAVSAVPASLPGRAARCLHQQRPGRQQQLLPAAASQPPHIFGRPRHPHEHRRSARPRALRLRRPLQRRHNSRSERLWSISPFLYILHLPPPSMCTLLEAGCVVFFVDGTVHAVCASKGGVVAVWSVKKRAEEIHV